MADHSNNEQARTLLRLVYEWAPPYNPYTIVIEAVLQTFHSQGGELPSIMAPTDLQRPELFFHAVERAAGAVDMQEIAQVARSCQAIAEFEDYLHMLKEQVKLPVNAASFLEVGMVEALRDLLLKSYPAPS